MLEVGEKAPNFEVKDHLENTHTLDQYKGQKLIIFFYPKASTPVCTSEVQTLKEGFKNLREKGFKLLGVSLDSVRRQRNFALRHELPFPLLADVEKQLVSGFGVYGLKKFMGKEYLGIRRRTFLIDEQGVVTHRIDKVNSKDHANQILSLFK